MVLAIQQDTGEQNLVVLQRRCNGSGEPYLNRFGSHPNHENGDDSPWETIIQDEKVIAGS
jgi:hypothetical protein